MTRKRKGKRLAKPTNAARSTGGSSGFSFWRYVLNRNIQFVKETWAKVVVGIVLLAFGQYLKEGVIILWLATWGGVNWYVLHKTDALVADVTPVVQQLLADEKAKAKQKAEEDYFERVIADHIYPGPRARRTALSVDDLVASRDVAASQPHEAVFQINQEAPWLKELQMQRRFRDQVVTELASFRVKWSRVTLFACTVIGVLAMLLGLSSDSSDSGIVLVLSMICLIYPIQALIALWWGVWILLDVRYRFCPNCLARIKHYLPVVLKSECSNCGGSYISERLVRIDVPLGGSGFDVTIDGWRKVTAGANA